MASTEHVGVAEDDPRNAGPLAAFRPEDLTPAQLHARIEALASQIAHPGTRERMLARAAKVDEGFLPPPRPLIRRPGEFTWDDIKWAAHPDWVTSIREADETLPTRCLCLFYGKPALIHPTTGIIFAIALGSIGIVARLPDDPQDRHTRYDTGRIGPEWRLVGAGTEWALRAFNSAG